MNLKKFVKLSSVTNLSDARYGAGMGVDLIGFSINPSDPNYTSTEVFNQIKTWISGPGIVGEYNGDNLKELEEQVKSYDLDFIEITSPEFINNLTTLSIPLIININVGNYKDVDELIEDIAYCKDMVSYTILTNHTVSDISLDHILRISERHNLLLAQHFPVALLESKILSSNLQGISINGGREEKVGYKDYDEIADILEVLEID